MVCPAGGNYGLPFEAHCGVTQGGPLSSLMFNICVNCVVREWLRQVLGEDVAQGGVRDLVCNQCLEDGVEGIRDRWQLFVALLQVVWQRGSTQSR
jgi:hypothetical protein